MEQAATAKPLPPANSTARRARKGVTESSASGSSARRIQAPRSSDGAWKIAAAAPGKGLPGLGTVLPRPRPNLVRSVLRVRATMARFLMDT